MMAALVCLLTLICGVFTAASKVVYVKEGELVTLFCEEDQPGASPTVWKMDLEQDPAVHSDITADVLRQMGVLVHHNWLVILNASLHHQRNYSCRSFGRFKNQVKWFTVEVYAGESKEYEQKNDFPHECIKQMACTLHCPEKHIPPENMPNVTAGDISWQKDGKPYKSYFPRATEEHGGIYICSRSYLYSGQLYRKTFRIPLGIQAGETHPMYPSIISPQDHQVFHVDFGSTVVIDCVADSNSCGNLYWISESSFVDEDSSFPVFYNETCDGAKTTVSLVFKKITEEDLSKNYTCKLDSDDLPARMVTINIAWKPRRSYFSLMVCVLSFLLTASVVVSLYLKFKIDITLLLRDVFGSWSTSLDKKCYDAFLMSYNCDSGRGLKDLDRKLLQSTLEEKYGYNLCLYDRDVMPGEAVAEAVLDCIEQSRAVILVPTSLDPGPESSLLSVIHASLVERQTRLILINTLLTEESQSGSFPEALQLLGKLADGVTWKGGTPSTLFWKQLRYYLPAPGRTQRIKLLSQMS